MSARQGPAAEELARLREQVLDLGEAVTGLTGEVAALRSGLVAAYRAAGWPVPPEVRDRHGLRVVPGGAS